MLALWTKLVSRFQEDKGASMVEYALLVVLIAIIAIVVNRRIFTRIRTGPIFQESFGKQELCDRRPALTNTDEDGLCC